jgi:predicted amidophosphoribosyltransferase
MSGYSSTMRMEKQEKPKVHVCGDCGGKCPRNEELCFDCRDKVVYNFLFSNTGVSR